MQQKEFSLKPKTAGFHLVTDEVCSNLPLLPKTGLLHLFIKHKSAGLSLNENADPDVQHDLTEIFNNIVKERQPYYWHNDEGDDDMPAHAKSSLEEEALSEPKSLRLLPQSR